MRKRIACVSLLAMLTTSTGHSENALNDLNQADWAAMSQPEKAAYVRGISDALTVVSSVSLTYGIVQMDTRDFLARMLLFTSCNSMIPPAEMVKRGIQGGDHTQDTRIFGSPFPVNTVAGKIISGMDLACQH